MSMLAVGLAVTLLACGWIQIGFVFRYQRSLRSTFRGETSTAADVHWTPRAAVVLCVRGYDPLLDECLRGLLNQDYPDYVVHVVVDSPHDPAWTSLNDWQQRFGSERLRTSVLRDRRKTCSLKCSSLVQAIDDLDASFEVVALIDADVNPLQSWLRELVTPLADSAVGLSTGNRWFEPNGERWGTKVRVVWNAGAVIQMFNFEIPWGGSMAMRRADVEHHRVTDNWSRSFNDDVILRELFHQAGQRIHYVPQLLMINREEVPLAKLWDWALRQCLQVWLYHRNARQVGYFNVVVSLLTVAHLVGPPIFWTLGQTASATMLLAGLGGYLLNMIALVLWIEHLAQRLLRLQKQTVARLSWSVLWMMPLAHLVYGYSSVSVLFRRTLLWRGVRYRIHAPMRVEVLSDAPFTGLNEGFNVSII
jgi:cellulose synthase/poly-beta-1,6-N-acetylglucosamine synthase-like glycosyltransferase